MDILKRKYYCDVDSEKTANIVMKIRASEITTDVVVPARFVLVIDISGSMNKKVGTESSKTCLDKVKVFVKLLLENIYEKDFIAIVTFSDDAQEYVTLTSMTKKEKILVEEKVEQMRAGGKTNLENGLLTGLEIFKRNERVPTKNTRDIMIVFTDGLATKGETDSKALVEKYRTAQRELPRSVPLSAFTIGGYPPELLKELAYHLGDEAFYLLDTDTTFEADMLMPILLRTVTHVSNVRIEMRCLGDTEFEQSSVSKTYLQEEDYSSSSPALTYFIHGMTDNIPKRISVKLSLPEEKFKMMLRKNILRVTGTYLDYKLKIHNFTDFVVLRARNVRPGQGMLGHTLYSVTNGTTSQSSTEVANVLLTVAEERYRVIGMQLLKDIEQSEYSVQDKLEKDISEAKLGIEYVKKSFHKFMYGQTQQLRKLYDSADNWIEWLNRAGMLRQQNQIGKVYALHSSLVKEMPNVRGIFAEGIENQPHLHGRKLKKYLYKILQPDEPLKKNPKVPEPNPKSLELDGPKNLFEGKTMILSESLKGEKVRSNQVRLEELILRFGARIEYTLTACPYGGQPEWYSKNTQRDTYLICSKTNVKKSTFLVKQAKELKVPILKTQFLFECIKKKEFLSITDFMFIKDQIQ